jgi:D-aminopeptidase
MNRARIRQLGIHPGVYPTGPYNAITDVPGVLVGQATVIQDEPEIARTGITVIIPHDGAIGNDYAFAGFHRFNGFGEITGIQWLEESGLLTSAIALTNTQQVGMVRDMMAEFSFSQDKTGPFYLPVVGETFDGWLNGYGSPHITREHIWAAMESAKSGPVDEGNVGGGTGMICHDFKGGIGTSSRVINLGKDPYTVGVLVQANYGDRRQLRVDGVPVGREIGYDQVPSPWDISPQAGSIIIIVATNAPLLGDQCKRLAQRATSGLARVGGIGHNSSGDLFLAFATGNHIPAHAEGKISLNGMIPPGLLNPLLDGVAEAVEESILNALVAAETMHGSNGHVAYAIPLDNLTRIMKDYRYFK